MNKKIIIKLLLFFLIIIPLNVCAKDNGWEVENGYTFYYKDGEKVSGIQEIDGKWYLFEENILKTGWNTVDGKEYYSNQNGVMQFGWITIDGFRYYIDKDNGAYKGIYQINGKWYHFGEGSKRLKTGWSITLDEKEYYSDNNGVMQFGWINSDGYKFYIEKDTGAYKGIHQINGKWYHFGEGTSRLKTGWSITVDKREYYSDKNGVMQFGWVSADGYKFFIDKDTGTYKGIHQIDGKWYHFGEGTSRLKTGWSITVDKREYYSDKNGVMQFGWVSADGYKFFIDKDTGTYKGIHQIDGKWYHFGEGTSRLKTGWSITVDKREYYSDKNGVMQFNWVSADGEQYYINKDTGAYKGIYQIDENWYHFGEGTKKLKKGWSITVDKREYYSDKNGVMQFGWVSADGYKYYIDKETGAYKGIHQIDGNWYHFGENSKQMKIGWSVTLAKKVYYSNSEGILQKGNLYIDNNWYDFGDDYALKTGWQTINGKTYYFYSDGTKAKYFAKIAGVRYEFSTTGELQHSNIKIIADLSYHNGYVDWDTLWNSGEIDGVILRIGYSLGMDRMFTNYLSEARRLGIPYSVYHFSIAENGYEAQNEANHLLSWYSNNNLSPTYGVFYDIESWYNPEDGHSSDGISKAAYDEIISTYKTALNNNGIYMSLYTGKNYAETRLSDYGRDQISWIAHYATDCGYRGGYRGWQYTSKGSLPGVSGNVDLSVFYY